MYFTKILSGLSPEQAAQLTSALNRNPSAVYVPGKKNFERLMAENGDFLLFLVSVEEPSESTVRELVTYARGLEAGFRAWYRPASPEASAEVAS